MSLLKFRSELSLSLLTWGMFIEVRILYVYSEEAAKIEFIYVFCGVEYWSGYWSGVESNFGMENIGHRLEGCRISLLNKTESSVSKLWMLYFQKVCFRIISSQGI